MLISPEQKNTEWMKDFVPKFSKPGNLVMNAYAKSFLVAKACMFLPKLRNLIGCKVGPSCVTEEMLQLFLLCTQQVLGMELDVDKEEEVGHSADV